MKVKTQLKDRLFCALLCGAAFFAVTMPFRALLSVSGITEVRPASALPPVMGILFGPWGAFGAAAANLAADVLSGNPPALCLIGFAAQFLYGYLPYKLWYAAPFSRNSETAPPRLDTVKNVGKYIWIVLLDSAFTAALLGFLTDLYGLSAFLSMTTLMIFSNNFVFCMTLGIPLFILFTGKKNYAFLPSPRINARGAILYDLFFAASLLAAAAYAVLSAAGRARGGIFFAASAYVCASAYVFKPIRGKMAKQEKKRSGMSLNEKLILTFLLIGVAVSVTTGAVALMESSHLAESLVSRWDRIYLYISAELSVFYLITLAILWYAEKRVTVPIGELADTAANYVSSNQAEINSAAILAQCARFSGDSTEIGELARSFIVMTENIGNYVENIKKITAEKERIGAELSVATQIQVSLLPCVFPPFPEIAEIDVYASMTPAREVGGDFYDFFLTDSRHLAVVIADVSGKGVPAALFMVIAKTLIKNQTQLGKTPAEVFTSVNRQLCENNDASMFVTSFMGILDFSTGQFVYANAGHNAPLIQRAGGKFEWLKAAPGFVLAGLEGIQYGEAELTLQKGDVFFAYTDGVTEAMNSAENLYGDDRLIDTLNASAAKGLRAEELVRTVRGDVADYADGAEQADDITLLALRYIGAD